MMFQINPRALAEATYKLLDHESPPIVEGIGIELAQHLSFCLLVSKSILFGSKKEEKPTVQNLSDAAILLLKVIQKGEESLSKKIDQEFLAEVSPQFMLTSGFTSLPDHDLKNDFEYTTSALLACYYLIRIIDNPKEHIVIILRHLNLALASVGYAQNSLLKGTEIKPAIHKIIDSKEAAVLLGREGGEKSPYDEFKNDIENLLARHISRSPEQQKSEVRAIKNKILEITDHGGKKPADKTISNWIKNYKINFDIFVK